MSEIESKVSADLINEIQHIREALKRVAKRCAINTPNITELGIIHEIEKYVVETQEQK